MADDRDGYSNLTSSSTAANLITSSSAAANLTCQVFAQSCDVLDELINPEFLDTLYADDATWILTSAFIILTMQSGFAMLEIGVSSPGNEVNVMLKNVCDLLFATIAFYLVGYGIAYGEPSNGFMGMGNFLPKTNFDDEVSSGIFYSQYIFQLSFAATSTTIVSGATAMRIRFSVYCMYSFYSVIVYAFVAHWVWSDNGWLAVRGVHDFAGGGPVHILGGFNSYIAIRFLGSRQGRFDGSRPESDFAESSPTSELLALLVLWFAWIGFNCGSSFGITDEKWLVATRTAVSTMNSSAGGGIMGLIYSQIATKRKFVRPCDVVNGVLGGLISSSPTSACVQPWEAIIIGAIGGLFACWSNERLFKKRLELDDPVGALGAHFIGACWGVFAVGLFASSQFVGITVRDGLFHGGGFAQLGSQCLEIVVIIAWSIGVVTPFFYILGVVISRDLKDPRSGLRLIFPDEQVYPHRADIRIHGCQEDNVDMNKVMDKVREEEYFEDVYKRVLHRLQSEQLYNQKMKNKQMESNIIRSLAKRFDSEGLKPVSETSQRSDDWNDEKVPDSENGAGPMNRPGLGGPYEDEQVPDSKNGTSPVNRPSIGIDGPDEESESGLKGDNLEAALQEDFDKEPKRLARTPYCKSSRRLGW